ncbi:MAG TPA: hypothetical protein PLQ93_07300 [Bacteroidia bacterium]|nr:hypothetical protein [Bacteroidia bacterium]
MKNADLDEPPLRYFNRDPLWVLSSALISIGFVASCVWLFMATNPLAFLMMIPAGLACFHSLWIMLNPFAGIYADKVVFTAHLLNHKQRHFRDIKTAGFDRSGQLILEYHDGETERIQLRGMRASQKPELLAALTSPLV